MPLFTILDAICVKKIKRSNIEE